MYENNCKIFNVNVRNTPDESLLNTSYRNCSLYVAIAAGKNMGGHEINPVRFDGL